MIETILVAAVLAAIVAAIIGKGIYNRARRKGGGCGGCSGCGSSCGGCSCCAGHVAPAKEPEA